ncbi:urokinase plasminogen activator surface receptor-like [Actinia tenebrosa]|uniref:Urokinase plasminogen activator surface receptor-like n=1 Tax=Actinia tenebrosa TaxID=6105 RepID=A0A6P8IBR9_ACTTE|nr:urokinase plasminogen activator surface receptor-like [Actinia tenebrosa]
MTADRVIGGQESQVTVSGCMSNCTTDGKTKGCAGEKNCLLTCCSYDNCNDANVKDNFPKCYFCSSNVSMDDCKTKSSLKTCKQEEGAQSYCYTSFNTITNPVTNVTSLEYKKDCSSSSLGCLVQGGSFCKGKSADECSYYKCCTGRGCNHSSKTHVSGILILACAIFMLLL